MTSPEPTYDAPPRDEVPVWVPFVALVVVLFLISLVSAAVYGIAAASDAAIDDPDDLPVGVTQALTFVQDVVFVSVAWVAVKVTLGRAPLAWFGLRRVTSFWNALGWAVVAYAIFWTAALALTLFFGDPDEQSLVTDLKEEDALGTLIVWAVLICVLAPIVEEFFFRGFMFTVFARRLGLVWAALLNGVVFGVGHAPADTIQLVALGAFGVGLCLLYWRTRSIIPCMALHALNNSITYGVTKDLDAGLFAGLVVLSVGTVIAAGVAVSQRAQVAA
jgi:uncharacterized protein